ncbi:hypothetical protein SDC9_86193 [bioreactor metagenome]|uniref:Uncharacterized protein n=1 Tax=bioreactor metagenome TaxID=1076179 RepID=A0A644ZFJ7_9ZZZZ
MIRGRNLNQCHIHRQRGTEQIGNIAEIYRGKIAAAFFDGLAGGAAEEQAVVAEIFRKLRFAIAGGPHGNHMYDLYVFVLLRVCHHGIDEDLWLSAGVSGNNPVARFNVCYRFFRSGQPLLI